MILSGAKKLLMVGGGLRSPVTMVLATSQTVDVPRGARKCRVIAIQAGEDGKPPGNPSHGGTYNSAGGKGGDAADRTVRITGVRTVDVTVGQTNGQNSSAVLGSVTVASNEAGRQVGGAGGAGGSYGAASSGPADSGGYGFGYAGGGGGGAHSGSGARPGNGGASQFAGGGGGGASGNSAGASVGQPRNGAPDKDGGHGAIPGGGGGGGDSGTTYAPPGRGARGEVRLIFT